MESGQCSQFHRPRLGSRSARTMSNWSLQPGESRTVIFLLGYHENPVDEKFDPPGSQTINKRTVKAGHRPLSADRRTVEAAFADLRAYWDELLGVYQVQTPDVHTNRMVNIWNAYQCMVTFNMSRSASFFESGIGRGMGFRDSNQDLLGFVHMIPDARPPAHPGSGRHPAGKRRRLSPVPAADQARQQRCRLEFQRRPAVAGLGVSRLSQGNRRLGHPGRAGAV